MNSSSRITGASNVVVQEIERILNDIFLCSLNSLFSIPRNKRFVCVNTNKNLRIDPLTQRINSLTAYIKSREAKGGIGVASDDNDSDDDIRPFKGFAKPLSRYKSSTGHDRDDDVDQSTNRLLSLINEHVDEALNSGFDDSIAKFKGKSHFVVNEHRRTYFHSNQELIDQIALFRFRP